MTVRKERPSLAGMARPAAGQRGTEAAKAAVRAQAEAEASGRGGPRSKATFDLPPEILAELRVASVLLPAEATGGSLSALAEQALVAELERLRAEFNAGAPFPTPRSVKARRGRPPGT